MTSAGPHDQSTIKTKRVEHAPLVNTGHAAPMTFFLRSEAEMERSLNEEPSTDRPSSAMADSSYGVQSLEDTMSLSNDSTGLTSRAGSDDISIINRKRKPGNPVHPKIYAAGQRIVSSEHSASPSSLHGDSPSRHQRRNSTASSTLTPLNLSPHPESIAGTPRSNSIRSLRLSDEEQSVASENSQVIHSSSEEEFPTRNDRIATTRDQQFVMPSISVPTRRPFTQRGREMGQFTIMIVGENATGKTSLIRSMFRICEDIVHIDGMGTSSAESTTTAASGLSSTRQITEIQASTKPYPVWWSDVESSRSWWRRKSFGGDVLERNICFIDTPGIEDGSKIEHIAKELDARYLSAATLDNMTDNQLLDVMSGKSNGHVDLVLYLVDAEKELSSAETGLLQELSQRTNLIPTLARCDMLDSATLTDKRGQLSAKLKNAGIDYANLSTSQSDPVIYTISSLVTDGDVMDASTLMASDYLPALAPSDLENLVHDLFEPETMARLRNESLIKFLRWRRQHVHLPSTTRTDRRQTLRPFPSTSPAITSTGSILDEPSKVLVPHAYSSYYRSTSPSGSDTSDPSFRPSIYELPQYEDAQAIEPSQHMHIAKWARDLRQSLRREGKQDRPSKGRLGGELGVIDPRDPLGLLSLTQSFRRRGWFTIQIVGGFGLLGAALYWTARNYMDWQEWMWPGQGLAPIALPAPTRSWLDNFRLV